MEKSIEQKVKDSIRISLEIIKNSSMRLLKTSNINIITINGYKATWKSGKYKIEHEENKTVIYCDIEKAIEIIYKGGKA